MNLTTQQRLIMGLAIWSALTLMALSSHGAEIRWMRATGYCPCRICCGPRAAGITATGRQAVGNIVAVDPRRIRLGSMVRVGSTWMLAADTGRLIKGNRVDVLHPDHAQAKAFGVRWVPIEIATRAQYGRMMEDRIMDMRFQQLVAMNRRMMR